MCPCVPAPRRVRARARSSRALSLSAVALPLRFRFRVWLGVALARKSGLQKTRGSRLAFRFVGSGRNASLMRVWLWALLLLVTLGVESWPDSRLALGFALARDSWLGFLA